MKQVKLNVISFFISVAAMTAVIIDNVSNY